MKRVPIYLCVGALTLTAQTTINGSRTILGTWDASGAAHSLPSKKGAAASIPAMCTTGEEYFATDAAAGRNKYYCTATNTWTQQVGSSGGSGGAVTYADIFDGSTATLADGSTVAWNCGSGSGAACTANWTAPAGVNALRIVAWSGGQGGAGSSSGDRSGFGGGGGGYYSGMCPVTPGNSYTVTVGLGGSGGTNGYGLGQSGGNSGFGTCFTLVGGGQFSGNFGGYMASAPPDVSAWVATGYFINSMVNCTYGGGGPANAIRADAGGCGAAVTFNAGAAGQTGGYGTFGGGGGGSGGDNSATGGTGGASGMGGAGGNGGAWTSGGGLVACTAGTIPGGGGGSAGVTSAGNGNQTGCAGARGEVRIYYTK